MAFDNSMTPLSEAYGGDWNDSPLPVWQRLAHSAQRYADKLALACLHQPADLYGLESSADDHLQWTYSTLSSATDLVSGRLRAKGLSRGTSVVTILDNGVEFALSFWAAHKLQCPFIPLNPRNVANESEMNHMLAVAKAAVVIVGSHELATAFDELAYHNGRGLLKIVSGESAPSGWVAFSDLLVPDAEEATKPIVDDAHHASASNPTQGSQSRDPSNPVTILFTSGTTSMPKGCPHTDQTLNAFMKNLALGGSLPEDIFCSVLPNNHAMGYFYVLHFFCQGGAVVYPAPTFNPRQMAKALAFHACTHTCLVPTALHSLIDHAERDDLRFPALKDVCLAGASITPQHLRHVVGKLGSRGVSTGFGMTEGSPIWVAATSDPETLIAGDDTISGSASPGASIKICESDATLPLPRGQPGEIHESGPGVIAAYLGDGIGTENFYVDGGRSWFKTGDRAVMHLDGRVSVVGRYKDMIIRGGENIAPAAIEAILNQFSGVEAQVVATQDPFAGEVPVAIVRRLPSGDDPRGLLSGVVRKSMGMLHVPDEFITLEDLGLDDYPRTMSGKVQKSTLRKLVAAFRKHSVSPDSNSLGQTKATNETRPHRSIEETVLHVWWRATGISPAAIDQEAPSSNFADSITIMRVRDMFRKELGFTFSAHEMIDYPSLRSQMHLLEKKSGHSQTNDARARDAVAPLSLQAIQLVVHPEDATSFKKKASAAVSKSGFDFDQDAAAVIQASDFTNVLIRHKLMDTWNFGIAIVADGSTVPFLRHALIAALQQSPLWTSFYVLGEDGAPFYITMKPQRKLYDHCVTFGGSVRNLAELQHKAIRYPHPEHATHPGLLFHALLYHVEELDSAAFVMYVHHAVHDASSMRLVLEDLDKALFAPERPLEPHVPFRTWADIYHSLRNSPRATMEVDWHVRRLESLHLHKKALYPPVKVSRQATTADPDGLDYGFDAPQLLNLKKHHPQITASVVLKAAMALVNITRTQHTHALFSNFEAARSTLPFWPNSLRYLPAKDTTSLGELDASDVAGPTMNAVVNLVPVERSESALDFLNRLQSDQVELTKHAHAPWRRIMSGLDALHPEANAGNMLPETHQTQFLTWVPGFLGDYERIRVAQIAIRAALGLVFVAGLGGPKATTYMISLRWDVANYSKEETERFVKDTEKAIVWLLEDANWGSPVGQFLDGITAGT